MTCSKSLLCSKTLKQKGLQYLEKGKTENLEAMLMRKKNKFSPVQEHILLSIFCMGIDCMLIPYAEPKVYISY